MFNSMLMVIGYEVWKGNDELQEQAKVSLVQPALLHGRSQNVQHVLALPRSSSGIRRRARSFVGHCFSGNARVQTAAVGGLA